MTNSSYHAILSSWVRTGMRFLSGNKYVVDELGMELKLRGRSVSQEYGLVMERKSSLSKRLRYDVVKKYEAGVR